jgi:hypothetical protein
MGARLEKFSTQFVYSKELVILVKTVWTAGMIWDKMKPMGYADKNVITGEAPHPPARFKRA